jgi:ElaB/YqjD/DUF883 family membrane-anchored ribosome-binding protein
MTDLKNIERIKKRIGKSAEETNALIKEKVDTIYSDLIDRVKDEREWIEREIRHKYRTTRRYVRANPEKGIGIALAVGLLIGIVIGSSKK